MKDPRDIVAAMRRDLAGEACYGGLDLASVRDLTALGLIFPREDCWAALCRFWMPEESIDDAEVRDRVPYRLWIDQGWIEATPGRVTDYEFVRHGCLEWASEFDLRQLAFDPWRATETALRLGEEGIEMVECRQGFRTMSEASKRFEALVLEERLAHGGNPVLRYMAECASVVSDPAGNIRPEKDDRKGRIDGIVALVMATWRAMLEAEGPRESPWEQWYRDEKEEAGEEIVDVAPAARPARKTSPWENWFDG